MKYDLRLNGFFIREIEGFSIGQALNNAGMDMDASEEIQDAGYLNFDKSDIIGMAKSGQFSAKLTDYVFSHKYQYGKIDFEIAK